MKDNQLEVGDQLIKRQYGKYDDEFITIERVTATQAIAKAGFQGRLELRFDRDVSPSSGMAWLKGAERFGPSYFVVDEHIRAEVGLKISRQKTREVLERINLSRLDDAQLEALNIAIQPFLPTQP